MKYIKFVCSIAAVLISLSCSDLLKSVIPQGVVSPDEFYKTASSFNTALNGVYAQLNNMSVPLILLGDAGTDISQRGLNGSTQGDYVDLIENTNNGPNIYISDFWKYSYTLINNANKIILEGEKLDLISYKDKYRYISEAKFLRALTYFYLVQFFGPIPLRLETTDPIKNNVLVSFSPVQDVYNAIIKDLQYCEGFYVTTVFGITNRYNNNFYLKRTRYIGTELGRPDFFVAKGLLSKVFLTKASTETGSKRFASLDSAKRNAAEVIGSGVYALNTSYSDGFSPDSKYASLENMISIQFTSTFRSRLNEVFGASPSWVRGLPSFFLAPWGGYFGLNVIQVPDFFVSQFNSADKRLPISAINSLEINTGSISNALLLGYITTKYYDSGFTSGVQGGVSGGNTTNTNILRYADILLIFAESENEINGPTLEAYDKLNQVLRRAGLPNINVSGGVTQDNLRNEILKQRALEFCYEGQRRCDLIRTGKLTQKLLEAGKLAPQYITFPYPTSELTTNPQ
jgi:starch-binding outer membrane protein, SusD/RagB family